MSSMEVYGRNVGRRAWASFVLILAMFCRSVSHLSNGLLRVEKRYTKARDIRKTVLKLR